MPPQKTTQTMEIKWIATGDKTTVLPDTKENRTAAEKIIREIQTSIKMGGKHILAAVDIDDHEAEIIIIPADETVPTRSEQPNYRTECGWSHYWEDRAKGMVGYETCFDGDINLREYEKGTLSKWFGPEVKKTSALLNWPAYILYHAVTSSLIHPYDIDPIHYTVNTRFLTDMRDAYDCEDESRKDRWEITSEWKGTEPDSTLRHIGCRDALTGNACNEMPTVTTRTFGPGHPTKAGRMQVFVGDAPLESEAVIETEKDIIDLLLEILPEASGQSPYNDAENGFKGFKENIVLFLRKRYGLRFKDRPSLRGALEDLSGTDCIGLVKELLRRRGRTVIEYDPGSIGRKDIPALRSAAFKNRLKKLSMEGDTLFATVTDAAGGKWTRPLTGLEKKEDYGGLLVSVYCQFLQKGEPDLEDWLLEQKEEGKRMNRERERFVSNLIRKYGKSKDSYGTPCAKKFDLFPKNLHIRNRKGALLNISDIKLEEGNDDTVKVTAFSLYSRKKINTTLGALSPTEARAVTEHLFEKLYEETERVISDEDGNMNSTGDPLAEGDIDIPGITSGKDFGKEMNAFDNAFQQTIDDMRDSLSEEEFGRMKDDSREALKDPVLLAVWKNKEHLDL